MYKDKLDTAEGDLKLLDVKIEADQKSLENLRQDPIRFTSRHRQRIKVKGQRLLSAVRERTGGLETEDEIDARY